MLKKLFILSLALAAVGCAGVKTVPLSEESIPMIEGRAISGSFSSEKPGFAAMTAGKGAFGALGAVAMISAGNKLVAENNVQDPAGYIYDSLATELAKEYSLRLLEDEADFFALSETIGAFTPVSVRIGSVALRSLRVHVL